MKSISLKLSLFRLWQGCPGPYLHPRASSSFPAEVGAWGSRRVGAWPLPTADPPPQGLRGHLGHLVPIAVIRPACSSMLWDTQLGPATQTGYGKALKRASSESEGKSADEEHPRDAGGRTPLAPRQINSKAALRTGWMSSEENSPSGTAQSSCPLHRPPSIAGAAGRTALAHTGVLTPTQCSKAPEI